MTEQPLPDFDGGEPRGLRGALAGGLSPQAIAALLLIAALLAVLYLLLGGNGDTAGTVKVTATPTRAAAAARATGGAAGAVSTVVNSAGTLPTAAIATGAGAFPTTLAGMATQAVTPVTGVSGASSGTAGSLATATTGAIDPTALAVGGFAKVSGTDGDGARLRFGFGLDTASIRWAEEGESLKILGGPEQADGYTWYRVQDNLGNVGWVASDFLRAAAGGAWAPPLASPTVAPN